MTSFGEWVRERRRAVGLRRQEELAVLVGVTQQTVSAWELGDAFPEDDKIPALAAALQCLPAEVLERAYSASYGTVGELKKNQRQIVEYMRREELRWDSASTILEAMTAELAALRAELRLTRDEASTPPGPPGDGPQQSVHLWPQPEGRPRPRR